MLRSGELSGEHEDGDERKPWRVHKWSAHALRDRHREDRGPTDRGTPSRSPREPRKSPENASELFRIIQDLQRELGRVEGRLEITETAESSLRADLEREGTRGEDPGRCRTGACGGAAARPRGRTVAGLLVPAVWRLRTRGSNTPRCPNGLRIHPEVTPGGNGKRATVLEGQTPPQHIGLRTSHNVHYAKFSPVSVTRNLDITATATGSFRTDYCQKGPDVSMGR
jgi:hypothetical protein